MSDYRAYIIRGGIEYEVTAELVDAGEGYFDSDETGVDLIVEQNPSFDFIYCEDPETGRELELTEAEYEHVVSKLADEYWKNYN